MTDPILKAHWERSKAPINLTIPEVQHLLVPWNNSPIQSLDLLSEGCINTNYKITFKNQQSPVVLRIYAKDVGSLIHELNLHQFMKSKLPVPEYFYGDDTGKLFPYEYAVIEWIEGEMMRDVILRGNENEISECTFAAGQALAALKKITFTEGGFFDEKFSVVPFSPDELYEPFLLQHLTEKEIQRSLSSTTLNVLKKMISEHTSLFPDPSQVNLVHADFDPANMLVKKKNNQYVMAGIIDWEFAFAGSYFIDMGMMLRYSDRLPACYEDSFIKGISSSGVTLPETWKASAKLMDLLSLTNLLYLNPPEVRPNLNRDVANLIETTVAYFNQ